METSRIEKLPQNVKELPLQFMGRGEVKGFQFTLICKTNFCFLYEVNTGSTLYYEIFKRRINHRFACISYPRGNSFGIWALTTPDLDRAYEILRELDSTHLSSLNSKVQ